MEYYVARDADSGLFIYEYLPKREDGYWKVNGGKFYMVSPRLFDIKWSDEPIKIKIEIL